MSMRLKTIMVVSSLFYLGLCCGSPPLREGSIHVLNAIWVWLNNLPVQFWATISGSLFTLLGVWSTNHFTDKRTEEAHRHDREQKRLDRIMNLRREIYLAAAEAINAGMNMLPKFADPQIDETQITKDYLHRSSALAKVQVICGIEVCSSVLEIVRAITVAIHDIGPDRAHLMAAHLHLSTVERNHLSRKKSRDEITTGMLEIVRKGSENDAAFKAHQGLITLIDETIKHERDSESVARDMVLKMQRQTMRTVVKNLKAIDVLTPAAYLAVRKELDLEVDADKFKALLLEHTLILSGKLEESLQDVEPQ